MKLLLVSCLAVTCLLVGCSATHVAECPPDVFVTKGDLTQPYTPIAVVESQRLNFYFLGISAAKIASPEADQQLNDVVNAMLVNKARQLGANAVICLEAESQVPYFPLCFYWERANGLAVKTR